MQKVAVFGNAGAGKSTLSQKLADITGLPWVPLDAIKYQPGGAALPPHEFKAAHDELLQQDQWIIDGFGSLDTVWQRLAAADTLVYLDLPVGRHYWWVTKRFLQSAWSPPAGWPEHSPLLKGTLNAYYTVWLCHTKLTPRYRDYVEQAKGGKSVYHLRSPQAIQQFYEEIAEQPASYAPKQEP
ncbi:adenylate kinase [Leptolyngbya iicbica]|uniref:Adenylate kinase n=2 Tax=Cyanophyceae TaxID=3028117 RepID=A0A4Q7EH58_9CYAN|nr:adenylate kinase [Leptolyngbya sp. LK]RZM82338.1 adenylate kinase [Leptolyngbya sp. LK]